jgi:hypothetical protein
VSLLTASTEDRTMRLYCTLAAAIGWASLILQYVIGHSDQSVAATINYFSFFTILSNILAAAMLTGVAMAPAGTRPWFGRPGVASAVTLYMAVTGLVYVFILQSLWNPQGWALAADSGLHHVMPVLVVLFWLGFVRHGGLGLRDVPPWLIFPALYGIYTLARGPFAAWYPYPFIDAGKLGYATTALNIVLLLAAFVALGALLVGIDRALARLVPAMKTAR